MRAALTFALTVACFALVAAPASAHVAISLDFRGPLPVGASERLATVTVVNVDEEGPTFTVCNLGECGSEGITVITACAVPGAEGECAQMDPGVISVAPTGTSLSNACAGMQFTVTEIAPGKLSINPVGGQHIVLPPPVRCRIDLRFNLLKAPTFDSRPDLEGLQTSQLGEVVSTEDLATGVPLLERGAGSLTVEPPSVAPAVRQPPLFTRPADVTAPILSRLSVRPARLRRRARTTVRYQLSEAARVAFRIERARVGRRVDGRCVRPTLRTRRAPRCRRYVALRGGFARSGSAGLNTFRYSGRVRGRRLTPGRYRLAALATDAAGNSSRRVTAPFRVLRRSTGGR
jgi:hypothetical protein